MTGIMNKEIENDCMLTTFDNPFNPFDDFERWWKQDLLLGYDTCGLLARSSNTSDVVSDSVNDEAILRAMKEIVSDEPMIYKIIYQDSLKRMDED